ncbi:hypothetical protein QR680_018877 [Steinernema hermaphroditum]|uniref:Chromatin modification-related protein MEAF6 n=1 Tax=Steinernema hermaphroditum TaxID=289476 RepID=A0AA39HJA2_9BILA|nr:hypothetical protein QR680_018877 [Steinernema hermaphroditum]
MSQRHTQRDILHEFRELQSINKKLSRELAKLDEKIYSAETNYIIESRKAGGNILEGFGQVFFTGMERTEPRAAIRLFSNPRCSMVGPPEVKDENVAAVEVTLETIELPAKKAKKQSQCQSSQHPSSFASDMRDQAQSEGNPMPMRSHTLEPRLSSDLHRLKADNPTIELGKFLWRLVLSELESGNNASPGNCTFWRNIKSRFSTLKRPEAFYVRQIWVMWDNQFMPGVTRNEIDNILVPLLGQPRCTANRTTPKEIETVTLSDDEEEVPTMTPSPPGKENQTVLLVARSANQRFSADEITSLWRLVIEEIKKGVSRNPTSLKFWTDLKVSKRSDLQRSAVAYARRMKKAWDEQEIQGLTAEEQALLLTHIMANIKSAQSLEPKVRSRSLFVPRLASEQQQASSIETQQHNKKGSWFSTKEITQLWRIILNEWRNHPDLRWHDIMTTRFWNALKMNHPHLTRKAVGYIRKMSILGSPDITALLALDGNEHSMPGTSAALPPRLTPEVITISDSNESLQNVKALPSALGISGAETYGLEMLAKLQAANPRLVTEWLKVTSEVYTEIGAMSHEFFMDSLAKMNSTFQGIHIRDEQATSTSSGRTASATGKSAKRNERGSKRKHTISPEISSNSES